MFHCIECIIDVECFMTWSWFRIFLHTSFSLSISFFFFIFNDLIFFLKWVAEFFSFSTIELISFSDELLIFFSVELLYFFLFSNNWVDIFSLRWVDIFFKRAEFNFQSIFDWSISESMLRIVMTIVIASLKSFEHYQRQIDENLSIVDLRHCQQTIE